MDDIDPWPHIVMQLLDYPGKDCEHASIAASRMLVATVQAQAGEIRMLRDQLASAEVTLRIFRSGI